MQETWPEPRDSLRQCRKWFEAAVDGGRKWREEAREDYEFTAGKQWTEEEIRAFREDGRPAITINRILPLLNILSGYQRINRYDLDFLPRSADDAELCQVRRGITKYVMDRCDYDGAESQVFLDCAIGGLGWFGVRYKYDQEIQDGEAVIERIDPFGMYIDPEAHELDYSDAKFLIRAKWVSKDELKQVYPEHAEAIENNFEVYDAAERESDYRPDIDPLYYSGELKKVRVVECWYKERVTQTILTAQGQVSQIPINQVKLCVFFDRTLLEEIASPYQHGEFPYVPMIYHYYGIGDTPAGFVRAMKDPQREVNKRRIQELHLLNTTANGGGWIEEGAMTPDQESEFKRKGIFPGHYQKVLPGAVTAGKIREREPKNPPAAIITVNQQIVEQDPLAGTIIKTLNDLSQGEFDIVINDVESSTTLRQAQLWSLVDAVSKLGIPADLVFETIIDLSDLPKKNDIKMRWQQQQQRQQEQAQQQWQAQIQLEEVKNRDFRQQIAFKDAPFPIQMAMAAKAGYVPQEAADYFVQIMIRQCATQMQPPIQQPPQLPQQPPIQQVNQAGAQPLMNGIAPAI